MKLKLVGTLALVNLLAALALLVLRMVEASRWGGQVTFEQVLALGLDPASLLPWAFGAAAAQTLFTGLLFGSLYGLLKTFSPTLAAMGFVLVPVYAVLNLIVYTLQLTVVPGLGGLYRQADTAALAEALLRMAMLAWPASATAALNYLAYAVITVPSIIFGLMLTLRGGKLKLAGALLALNGVTIISGLAALLLGYQPVASIVHGGGALYLPAMVPLCFSLLDGE